jgi:glycosyltransferase involved in cell wall biosynthesis
MADVVHIEFGSNDVEVFWFALAAVSLRPDVVVVVHDYPKVINHPAAALLGRKTRAGRAFAYRALCPALDERLKRLLLRRAGVVVAFSADARQGLVAAGADRVVEVAHGADPPDPTLSPPSLGETVLFAGFLGPSKGVDVLLEAWRRRGGQIQLPLVLAGAGDESWLAPTLREPTLHANQPQALGAIQEEEDFQRLIERAAIVVLPYRTSSPASGVFVRAFAAGRAVIATQVPATRTLEDGVNGVIVPIGDADALADAIARLAEAPEERDRLGRAAADTARREFSWSNHIDGLEGAYAAAAGKR